MPASAILVASLLLSPTVPPADLLTVAERSHWRATASYDEVLSLLEAIESRSPIARRAELGKTTEGRSIPLLVLANPPVETAQEAKAGGRAVVFVFGNIHAGEVCGKEALLMRARALALEPDHPLLEELHVLSIRDRLSRVQVEIEQPVVCNPLDELM